jgi:hypothetical protein
MGIRTVHLRQIKPRPCLHIEGIFYAFVEEQFRCA